MNWTEFFNMGGYAAYVWPAYILAAVVLIINIVTPIRTHRQVRRELTRQRVATHAPSSIQTTTSIKQ